MTFPEPAPPAYSDEDDCAFCYERLLIPPREGEDGPSSFIDDVKLLCGHHFHWTCFEDYDNASPTNRSRCPICRDSTLNANGDLIVDVRNEGGFTGGFDLGRDLDESKWRESQPESWKKGQALLSLCQFGEFEEAEDLLRDDGGDPNAAYDDGMTGLHMAAYNNSVIWASLLLQYGADKNRKNKDGATPLDCARQVEAQDVINLLNTQP